MSITPGLPGVGPATDVPSKDDPYRNEPGAPDIKPGGDVPDEEPDEKTGKAGSEE